MLHIPVNDYSYTFLNTHFYSYFHSIQISSLCNVPVIFNMVSI